MTAKRFFLGVVLAAWACVLTLRGAPGDGLERREWTVDGVTREALVHIPDGLKEGDVAPVVFGWHGHGGSMRNAARSFRIHQLWPEAIVVYPQGLPTRGMLTDPEGKKSGWQVMAGMNDDRDLKFFDAMLADLRAGKHVDEKRIYSTGHSNGGAFTYLLWAERGDAFAAFAPSAALLAKGFASAKPKSVLHIGSPKDGLVKFAWQARMLDRVLALNGCGSRKPEAPGYENYPSPTGADTATFLHDGGHAYPSEAPALIVAFFKAHPRK